MAHDNETHITIIRKTHAVKEEAPMKKWISIFCVLLVFVVLLSACAGEPEPSTVPTTEPTTPPTTQPATEPPTEPPTEDPTEPPTEPVMLEPTVDPSYIAYYYSFSTDEISAAKEAALAYIQTIEPDPDGITEHQVLSIAYDPELTSLLLHQRFGWERSAVADRYIAFSFFYRGNRELDGGVAERYEDTGYILCHREKPDALWSVEKYSETGGDPTALPAEYLPVFGAESQVVAGYTRGIDGLTVIARYNLWEDYYRTLAYTLDPEQILPEGTALTESELQFFEKLFDIRETEDPWFNYALTSEYSDPADVDIYALLYSGPSEALTQEDRDYAEQKGLIPEILNKYSSSMIDSELYRMFGITLEESNGIGLDQFAYYPEADCYYDSHGDSKVSYQKVIGGIRMPGGDIAVYYERQQVIGLNPAQTQMVVVLRPMGDSYQILMNVRAGLGYEVINRTEPLPTGYTLEDLVSPIRRDLEWDTSMLQSGIAKFSIPQIYPFSADAVRIQQQIQENYMRQYYETYTYYMLNANAGMSLAPHYCEISYEAALNGEVLSIVIYTDMFVDSQGYQVRNFNLRTGKLLDNAELLEILEIEQTDYEQLLGSLVSKSFTDKYGESIEEGSRYYDFYYKQKALNDSPENIATAKLYLDTDGNLWAICNVYSLAGAASYSEVFSLSELMS